MPKINTAALTRVGMVTVTCAMLLAPSLITFGCLAANEPLVLSGGGYSSANDLNRGRGEGRSSRLSAQGRSGWMLSKAGGLIRHREDLFLGPIVALEPGQSAPPRSPGRSVPCCEVTCAPCAVYCPNIPVFMAWAARKGGIPAIAKITAGSFSLLLLGVHPAVLFPVIESV